MKEKLIARWSQRIRQGSKRISAWLNRLSLRQRRTLLLATMLLVALLLVLQSAWSVYKLRASRSVATEDYSEKWKRLSWLLEEQFPRLDALSAPLSSKDSATCHWLRAACFDLEE
ncbi:MAG: hypothetical protein J6Z12_03470 [Paludibacteraceae bacterium]|nr:hypothetical protein [Paludibacteraceae bacterium]